jgi:ankyrin repeat protein
MTENASTRPNPFLVGIAGVLKTEPSAAAPRKPQPYPLDWDGLLRVPDARGTAYRGSPPPSRPAVRRYGTTALMVAAANDHHEIVERLVGARADVNTKNSIGGCALPRGPSGDLVGCRLRLAPAPSGRSTALHWAAGNGRTKSAVALLVGGADQTVTNDDG